MSAPLVALGVVVMAVGASIQSTIGFGAALFAVPVLLLIDPDFVPGPATVAGLALNLLMIAGHRAHTDRAGLRWIAAGLVPGAAVAAVALATVPGDDLAILSGAAILVAVAISVVGGTPRKRPGTLFGAGVASGFMGSTAAVSGPPLALLYQHDPGPVVRGTLPPAFVASSTLALVSLSLAGRLPASDWLVGLALAPGGVLGYLASTRWAGRVEGPRLRYAVLVVSTLSAVAAIVRAIA